MSDDLKYRDKIEMLLLKHTRYFDQAGWPKLDTEAWADLLETWCDAFGESRISPNRVEKAVRAIRRAPPAFKTEHLPELLRLIAEDAGQAAAGIAVAPASDSRAAPHCPLCDGAGLVRAYRADYLGEETITVERADGSWRRVYLRVVAACPCPYGRWVCRENARAGTALIDGDALPRGWSLADPTATTSRPDPGHLRVAPASREEIPI